MLPLPKAPPLRWVTGTALLAGLSALVLARPGVAQPPAPASFCSVYPDVPACAAGEVTCTTCHTAAPALNPYGVDIESNLLPGEPRPLSSALFTNNLADALAAVEDLDSDGDGYDNLTEIQAGSAPADAKSVPAPAVCEDPDADGWELCAYDSNYVYKKLMIDFCGRSPSYLEREEFRVAKDQRDRLHSTLDVCLQSEYWRGIGGQVWNLGNRKIGPLQAIKSGKDVGPIPLADYDDDYAYFVWTQTENRDIRLVLTGQTFVTASLVDGTTVYEEWDRSPGEDYTLRGYDRYQAVVKDRRAGLLTHRWFLMTNTMFTAVPRTTAAQAYRVFLGYDIALLQGLSPVEGEPVDYDNKGVGAEGCASCHSTLDALTYPFSRYEGIGGGDGESYTYNSDRMAGFAYQGARVTETPEQGVLLGQPVADLLEWAQVAAESDAFVRASVLDYWTLLLGEPPRPTEQAEYAKLAEDLRGKHAYGIERMLHDLIDTEAYGVP